MIVSYPLQTSSDCPTESDVQYSMGPSDEPSAKRRRYVYLKTSLFVGKGEGGRGKVGTKASACISRPERYLSDFGIEPLRESSFASAEKYLVRVISPRSNCETFDQLRYQLYKSKEKVVNELPPTSSAMHGYLLRSHYFVYICSSLLDTGSKVLEPTNYGWFMQNGLLVPAKNFTTMPSHFTTKCHCKKGCARDCGCKRKLEKCTKYCGCVNCENL